jgi:hypothetical protein
MARITNKPKEEHLVFLRKEISKKHGNNVLTVADCEWLSYKMDKSVSVDTLRRLFNIIKNNNTISILSLNYCAVYCGYNDWGSFIEYYNQTRVSNNKTILLKCLQGKLDNQAIIKNIEILEVTKEVYDLFIQIMLVKVIQEDKDFFINIFEFETLFVDVEKNRYEIYYIIHLLSTLCQSHKWLQKIATENYFDLDNRYGFESDFFIEWLVTPQFEFYRTLLHNYQKAKKENLKATAFYYLTFAKYYAEIEDWENFRLQFLEINAIDFNEINHNILSMSQKGIEIIHAKKFKPNELIILCSTIEKINFSTLYKDTSDRITALLFISIYLYKCEQYQIIINCITKNFDRKDLIFTQWGEQNWNHFKIIYADCLQKSNEKDKAKEIFNTISNTCFDLNFAPFTDTIYEELKIKL